MRRYEMKKWWDCEEEEGPAAGSGVSAGTVELLRTASAEASAARAVAAEEAQTEATLDAELHAAERAIAELTAATAAPSKLSGPGQPIRFPQPWKRDQAHRPRLLVLHGYTQSASMLYSKTKKLRQALVAGTQLVFVDGPHVASAPGATPATFGDVEQATRRCWWHATERPDGTMCYEGCEESLSYIERILRDEGPFDGVIGFSQGAVLAHLLLEGGAHPELRCAICISGFASRDPVHEAMVAPGSEPIPVPSLHIIGERDALVEPSRSEAMAARFENATIITHAGGHFSPAQWPTDEIAAFVGRMPPRSRDALARAAVPTGAVSAAQTMPEKIGQLQIATLSDEQLCLLCDGAAAAVLRDERWALLRSGAGSEAENALAARQLLASVLTEAQTPRHLCEDLFVLGWALRGKPSGEEQPGAPYDRAVAVPRPFFTWLLELAKAEPAALALFPMVPALGGHWRDLVRLGVYAEQVACLPVRAMVVATFVKQLRADIAAVSAGGGAEISEAALSAPRKHKAKNGVVGPAGLSKSISFLLKYSDCTPSALNVAPETGYCYKEYTDLCGAIKAALKERDPMHRAMLLGKQRKEHRERQALEEQAAALTQALEPLSDHVIRPKPEPVVACDLQELAPVMNWLESDQELGSTTAFDKGTFMSVDGFDGRLDLCKQVVGPTNIKPLVESLKKSSKIGTLMIGNNIVGSAGAEAIASAIINRSTSIKTWYIAGNEFGPSDIGLIAAALSFDNVARALWLKRNPLLPSSGAALASMLQHNATLETLDLVNTGLLDEGVGEVFGGLAASRHTLRHLYIDGNGLTLEGVKTIVEHCKAGAASGLVTLSVGANRLCDAGAAMLCEALAAPGVAPMLERLCLASNRISGAGLAAIIPSVSRMAALRKLDLGYLKMTAAIGEKPNSIGTPAEGMAALRAWLRANPPLRVLDVSRTGLSPQDLAALAADLASTNTNLAQLKCVQRGGGAVPAIEAVMQRNREGLGEEGREEAEMVDTPAHIRDILSVYRTA